MNIMDRNVMSGDTLSAYMGKNGGFIIWLAHHRPDLVNIVQDSLTLTLTQEVEELYAKWRVENENT